MRNPHDYDEDLNDIVMDPDGNIMGTYIHRVTLVDDNIYQPTSIDANMVDLKLSKLAFKENRGNMFHFNVRGHFDAGSQATTAPNKLLLSNYQDYDDSFPCRIRLVSADETNPQIPLGEGTMRIATQSDPGCVDLRTFHAHQAYLP